MVKQCPISTERVHILVDCYNLYQVIPFKHLIEKHVKIRIEQFKSREGSDVDTDKQFYAFGESKTVVLPYFGQILNTIQFMLWKFLIYTIFRIAFRMETLITLGNDVLNGFEKSGVVYKLICKKYKVTYAGQTSRLQNTRVKEHKKNLGRKCNYHNVLSDHRKEYSDYDFDWNNIEIFQYEINKGKREFMEMLYIEKEREDIV